MQLQWNLLPTLSLLLIYSTSLTPVAAAPPETGHKERSEGLYLLKPPTEYQVNTAAGAVVTLGRFTSVQVNVDALGNNIPGDAANEPSIAVDPTDRSTMAIGWREFSTISSVFRQSGVAHSTDGGSTWTFPGVVRPGEFASDPVLRSNAAGEFYYLSLQPNRGPGAWQNYMYRSFNSGVSWPQDVYAFGGDKAWFAIDNTGGMGDGHLYQVWSPNPVAGCCPPNTFTRSTDGGLTWSTPMTVPLEQFSGTNTVAPDGALYTVGSTITLLPQRFIVSRSDDAQNSAVTPTWNLTSTVDLDGVRAFSAGPNPVGLLGQATIVADHSGGPTHGNVYVLSSVRRNIGGDPCDVMFSRSTDRGVTWSTPVRINDDSSGNDAWQWFGTIAVAPNGRIDVVWNDTRNDATPGSPTFSELYYSFSLDGGATWSANEPSSPPFNHFLGYPGQNKLGDYYDMDSGNVGGDLAWAATFNGEQDVYFLRVTPDCNGNGMADADDVTNLTSEDCNGNLIPDECEPDVDCNANLIQDICDIASMTSEDCNTNLIPDECEPQEDCNTNLVQDICDIAAGTSVDCNADTVPDECEPDADCNSNGILDECDIAASGGSEDCNGNMIPDECDIASGASLDADMDGVPDECVGACCVCAMCLEIGETACNNQNGVFQGVGTVCNGNCATPANDVCTNAEILPSDLNVVRPFDLRCTTSDGPPQLTCDTGAQPISPDVWYQYEAPCCGLMTVSLCDDTTTDTMIGVYGGDATCSCPSDTSGLLACGDDTCGIAGGPSAVTIPVSAGGCFTIQVGGWSGTVGEGALEVSLSCYPSGGATNLAIEGHWSVDLGTTYPDQGAFADMTVDGDMVYMGQLLDNKVHFVDVSDRGAPEQTLEWVVGGANTSASTEDVKVGDGLLFISLFGDGNDGVEIVDVRNPAAPVHLTWVTVPGFEDVRNTFYDNGYLYLANGSTNDLAIVDLSAYDPDAAPATITTAHWQISAGTSWVEDLTVQNGRMYVAAWNDGVLLYDVSDIAASAPTLIDAGPVRTSTHAVSASANGQWVVANRKAPSASLDLYEVVATEAGSNIELRQFIAPPVTATSFHPPHFDGDRVHVASLEAGLLTYELDAANGVLNPTDAYASYYFATAGGFNGAFGVDTTDDGEYVLISDTNTGLHVVRIDSELLDISYPDGLVRRVDPAGTTTFTVQIESGCSQVDPSTATLFVRNSLGGPGFTAIPMTPLGDDLYEAVFPSDACGSVDEYYVAVDTLAGQAVVDPPGAPHITNLADVVNWLSPLFEDTFEADLGWTNADSTCSSGGTIGSWQRVDPVGTLLAPEFGSDDGAGANCLVTADGLVGGNYFAADVDGGPFRIVSPSVANGGEDVRVRYERWFYSIRNPVPANEDFLVIEVSTNGGGSWNPVETVASTGPQWIHDSFKLGDVAPVTNAFQIRLTANDCPNNGVTEAAFDHLDVSLVSCGDCLPVIAGASAEPGGVDKNRYLSFIPSDLTQDTAIRVGLIDLDGFPGSNGEVRWVGPPTSSTDIDESSFMAAPLQCTPHFMDWSSVGLVHAYGAEVVPGSHYMIQHLDVSCSATLEDEGAYSPPLNISTQKWGDVATPFGGSAQPNFADVTSIVDSFKGLPSAPRKTRAQLQPNVPNPDGDINFADISLDVDAFKGDPYSFAGPIMCP